MNSWDLFEPTDIISKLPTTFEQHLTSTKWQERKSALEELLQLLTSNPRLSTNVNYNDIMAFLKKVLDKDTNINVTAIAAKCITGFAKGLQKKFGVYAREFSSVIFERFKEKKSLLKDALIECIDVVYTTTNLESLAEVITVAATKPNPNIKIQLDLFLYRVCKSLKTDEIPKKFIKEFIPTLIKHANESDSDVRDAACSALGAIMKCLGPNATNVLFGTFTNDKLKMAKVEEFYKKAVEEAQIEEEQKKNNTVNNEQCVSSANEDLKPISKKTVVEEQIDTWDLLDPVDIISKISPSFKDDIQNKKWLVRKTALEDLHKILSDNPRLSTKANYGGLIEDLCKILDKDSNVNVAYFAAKCLGCIAKGLRKDFNPHARPVVPIIFAKFKEKKAILRDQLVECIDIVFASTNLEAIADDILEAAKKPNPDIKIQLDLFLFRVIKCAKATDIPKKFLKEFTAILIKHIGDSDPEVRNASCSALGAIMKCVGQKTALILFGDLASDKLKMAKIEEFYNKALNDAGQEVVSAMVTSMHKQDNAAKINEENNNEKIKKLEMTSNNETLAKDNQEKPLKPSKKNGEAKNEKENKSKQIKVVEEKIKELEDTSLLKSTSDRAGRLKDEKAHKLLKWNFELPTAEHLQQLTTQLSEIAKPALCGQLLNKDFKQHIKAIDYFQQLLLSEPIAIINNIDIILKWATLRFFDTNPAVLIRLLEFIGAVFGYMDTQNEALNDIEMTSFLPYLILKSGDTKDIIRNNVRKLVKLMGGISVPGKIFPILLESLKTKNSRQKAECLIIIDSFLECIGVNITATPQITMKVLAACISDRDSSVRNAALNAVVTVYKKIGDRVFALIGQLNEKEKAMLDERIKRSGKFIGAPDADRPTTMKEQLNHTISVVTPVRARSSSSNRRSLNTLSNKTNTMRTPNENLADATFVAGKGSNSKYRQSFNALPTSSSKFQLDSKFFSNDFEDVTNALENKFESFSINNNDTIDLNMIQPAVKLSKRSSFTKRSESISSISSLESAEQIDRTVHNLSCLSLNIADEAMAQLLHLLHDTTNKTYIVDRSDLIFKTFITQFFHIQSQHFENLESNGDDKELAEFMRSVCNFLSSLVKHDEIICQITADTMRAFIDAILCFVTDSRLTVLSTYRQVFRSLNVVIIRFCESSNSTNCFTALMKLLIKYQNSDSTRILNLIRKCLYKHVDVFLKPEKYENLDLDVVFKYLFSYYNKFCVEPISDSVKETNRSINFYIQRLVVTKRYKVLNYLHLYSENSLLVTYIRRCVRAIDKEDQSKNFDETVNNDVTTVPHNVVPKELTNLFKRINDDIFDGCVEELYNFMDVHPEQNGKFEELMESCQYSCLIHRAFSKIRQVRSKKETILNGDCVKLILPKEDREFLEQQRVLQKKLDEYLVLYNQKTKT